MDTTSCEMPNDLRLLTGSIAEGVKETSRPRQLHSQVCEEAGTQVLHTLISVLHGPHYKHGEDATLPVCSDTRSFGHQKDMSE